MIFVASNIAEGLGIVQERVLSLLRSDSATLPALTVAGVSQAGKSYFTKRLEDCLQKKSLRLINLRMDSYYFTKEELVAFGMAGDPANPQFDFDQPSSVDLKQLAQDVTLLKHGKSIKRREYKYPERLGNAGFPTARRIIQGKIEPNEGHIICVEGLFVHHEIVRNTVDLSVFIDQPNGSRRLETRIKRDTEVRGYSEAVSRQRWHETIEPSERKHIIPPNAREIFHIDVWIENRY
jgi:uridine kinase